MRKGLLIIVTILFSLFVISDVNAAMFTSEHERGNLVFTKTSSSSTISSGGITYPNPRASDGVSNLNIYTYKFTNNSSPDFQGLTGYCLDPNVQGARAISVKRVFFSDDIESGSSYDAAVMEILIKGYGKHNTSYTYTHEGRPITISGTDLEMATSMAIRTMTLAVYRYGKNTNDLSTALTQAYIRAGAQWAGLSISHSAAYKMFGPNALNRYDACKSFINNGYGGVECFKELNKGYYSNIYNEDSWFGHGEVGSQSYNILYGARALFMEGIAAAEKYLDEGHTQASVNFSKISSDISRGIADEATVEEIIFNVSIHDFSGEGYVKDVKFVCDDCATYGISLEGMYFENSGTWATLSSETDLSDYVDSNGNVRIKFVLNKDPNEECDPVNYEVTYKMYEPANIYTGAVLYNVDTADTSQRYVVVVENTEATSEGNIIVGYNGTITCDKAPCETTITAPQCADAEGENYIYCADDQEKTYYTTSYVGVDVESGTSYKYRIRLDDIDPAKVSESSVGVVNSSKSYFGGTEDYQEYINSRDEHITLLTAAGTAHTDTSHNVYMTDPEAFKASSLKRNNFDFNISGVKLHDDGYYYVEVTIEVKGVSGVTPYASSNAGEVYFVPVKFDVAYSNLDDCVVDSAELADEYSAAGYSVGLTDDQYYGTVEAPTEIKKCVIENTDEAGNTYQLSDDNNGVDNDYCEVFCKEDYAKIQLNEMIETVKCGSYFKLEARIEGSKDCYTGSSNTDDSSIDKEQYVIDIVAAQRRLVAAYNDYLLWNTLYNTTASSNTQGYSSYGCTPCTNSDGCCGCPVSGYCTSYLVTNVGSPVMGYNLGTPDADGVMALTKDKPLSDSYSKDGGSSGSGCNSSCTAGTSTTLKSNLKTEKLDPAIVELNAALENYKNIISDYNACTTVWENVFQFEEIDIEWEYDQIYFNLLKHEEDKDLTPVEGTFVTNSTIEVCTGDTNEEYVCQFGSNMIAVGDGNILGTYNYSSAYDSVFTHRDLVICDTTGCKTDDDAYVSDAKFVRKSEEAEQDYITPTVYAQIAHNGKITVDIGYTGNELQLDILENMLPVSLDTTGGGTFYLRLQDIGEFYEDGDLGRLFDFEEENEDKSVAYAHSLTKDDTFSGEYICNYVTECRPTACNPDDPESPGYNPSWQEDGWINGCIPDGTGTPEGPGCPDCDYSCWDEPGTPWDDCEWEPCEGECKYECLNCIFDFKDLQLNFKTISTTNFNSANRAYGYNWITDTSYAQLSLLALKSQATIEEIEDANETIYNEIDKGDGEDTSLEFSITLTPEMTREIQDYNVRVEGDGGYANDSLTCYDYTAEDGSVYPNIFCYSDFLDELFDLAGGDEDIINAPNRLNDGRGSDANASGYWETWPGYVYNESVIGGPSWK